MNRADNDDYYFRNTELTDLKIAANKLRKSIDQIKIEIEIDTLDKGHKNYNKSYKKNLADKVRKMGKVYGPKEVNAVKK